MAADGPNENWGLEQGEGAASGQEAAREVSEQFSEQMRKDQAALQALFAEEGKQKKKDQSIATSIAKFLSDQDYAHLAFLVAKLVSQNTPSDFILALLALIDSESKDNLLLKFEEAGVVPAAKGSYKIDLEEHGEMDQQLSEDIKAEIDEWVYHIYQVGTIMPDQILHSLVSQEGEINVALTQLATFVLDDFLKKHAIQKQYELVNTFITILITKILTSLKQATLKHIEKSDLEEI